MASPPSSAASTTASAPHATAASAPPTMSMGALRRMSSHHELRHAGGGVANRVTPCSGGAPVAGRRGSGCPAPGPAAHGPGTGGMTANAGPAQKTKRQRLASPSPRPDDNGGSDSEEANNGEGRRRTHVMPMFLCIPMLLLGLSGIGGAEARGSSSGSGRTQQESASVSGGGRAYRPKRPVAPSRPVWAADVDYGGAHPFDQHRHLYDPHFARRMRQEGGGPGLKRRLKKDEDKDKDKDKDKEKDKWDKWEEQKWEEKEEEKWYEEEKVEDKSKEEEKDNAWTKYEDDPTGEGERAPSLDHSYEALDFDAIFEGVDADGINVASATSGFDPAEDDGGHSTTTLDPNNDHLYRPLRVQFDVRQLAQRMEVALSAGDSIAATKLYLLVHEILPMTARVWGDALRVVPVTGGIYPLAARGSGVDQLLPNGQSNEGDASFGDDEERFRDDPVRLTYCPDETTSGIEGGADLLIYATVNRHCSGTGIGIDAGWDGGSGGRKNNVESMGTLASALSCQRDQYDRPITGSIDFCLGGMRGVTRMDVAAAVERKEAQGVKHRGSKDYLVGGEGATYEWDGRGSKAGTRSAAGAAQGTNAVGTLGDNRDTIQYSVGVAIHEIGHVLGVTSDSLAYYRHPLTGHPLTRRPFEVSMVTCVDGETMTYVGMPGPQVLQEGRHETSGSRFFQVVTPTVKRVVRNHFNCRTMPGARLENQPTSSDCFGSHFDEMLHYTEIMGAVFSQSVNILSPLTLALLEDSGWYRANYQSRFVQISVFGHGAGCDFAENNCIGPDGDVPDVFSEHYCNDPIAITANGLIDPGRSPQTCDPSHTQKTYCDLIDANEIVAIGKTGTTLDPPPSEFQYFLDRPNLRPYIFTTSDYCPVPHLDPQSCIEDDGRVPITSEQIQAGEYRGPDARCVETDGSRGYSLCLKVWCNARLGRVQVRAGGQRRTCEYDGQVHRVLYNYDGAGELRIKCPKASLVCPALFCPANCAGRGDCVYASDRGRDDDDGDDDLFLGTAARARCACDADDDGSEGCFGTRPAFPAAYGYAYEDPDRADKTLFMVIVGSLVAGLAAMFVVVRQWKARQNVFM